MKTSIFTTIALFSALAFGACTTKEAKTDAANSAMTQTANDPAPAVANGAAAKDTPQAAENQPTIDHPLTKAIVVPPKPKSGAPHGPGFDMPLIDLGGYAPPRPMEVLRD